jgi:hypothetical protein
MMYAMRSFEKINDNEERLQTDMCEVGFQHMTGRHCQCCHENKGEEEGGENESEIHTVMRISLNSSQKQVVITYCFSK